MHPQIAEFYDAGLPLTPIPGPPLTRDLGSRPPVRATAIATCIDPASPRYRTVIVRFDPPEAVVDPNDWAIPEDVDLWQGEAVVERGLAGAFDDAIARYLDLWGESIGVPRR